MRQATTWRQAGLLLAVALLLAGTWAVVGSSLEESAAQPTAPSFSRFRLFNDGPDKPVKTCRFWAAAQVPSTNPDKPASWGTPAGGTPTTAVNAIAHANVDVAGVGAVAVEITWADNTSEFAYTATSEPAHEMLLVARNTGGILFVGQGPGSDVTSWVTKPIP